MAGLRDSVGRTAKRVLLGLLVVWAIVPLLMVLLFLGWAAVAAEGLWKVPFVAAAAGLIALLARWGVRSLRQRAERRNDGEDARILDG